MAVVFGLWLADVRGPQEMLPPFELPWTAHVRSDALEAKLKLLKEVVILLISVTMFKTDKTEEVFSVPVGLGVVVIVGSNAVTLVPAGSMLRSHDTN